MLYYNDFDCQFIVIVTMLLTNAYTNVQTLKKNNMLR